MLEWINEDFFWIPNKASIYNINGVERFTIKEDDYRESLYTLTTVKKYFLAIRFTNNNVQEFMLDVKTREEANIEIIEFLKCRPTSKKNDKNISKILID